MILTVTVAPPSTLNYTLTGPAAAAAGQPFALTATLTDANGVPFAGKTVDLMRATNDGYAHVQQATTDASGVATFSATVDSDTTASFVGMTSIGTSVYYSNVVTTTEVENQPPTAAFIVTTPSPLAGQPVSFDGTASYDPDGTITSYAWTFGDGNTSTEDIPEHTYASPGTYTVTLTVTDDGGLTNTTSQSVTIDEAALTISLYVPPTVTTDVPFTLTATVKGADGNPIVGLTVYIYADGDSLPVAFATTDGSGLATFTRAETEAGSHQYVAQTSFNETGYSSNLATTTAIANAPPIAAFTITTAAPQALQPVSFDASTSTDPDGGSITDYAWTFGDGDAGTGVTPQHTYTAPGTYTVTLNVTDSDGGLTNETSHSVTIVNVAPIAAFTVTPPHPQTGQPVSFDASTSTDPDGGSITDYPWTFGDGNAGSGVTTQHTYATPGTYTVTLTVTDDGGLTNTTSHTVTVAAQAPTITLSGPTTAIAGQPFTLTATFIYADGNSLIGKRHRRHRSDPTAAAPLGTPPPTPHGVATFSRHRESAPPVSNYSADFTTSADPHHQQRGQGHRQAPTITLSGPTTAIAGKPFTLTATVLYADGNSLAGYSSAVDIARPDGRATS